MSAEPAGNEDFGQQQRTFRLELARALPNGFVETASTTFVLFVAIRIFDLPPMMKALLVAATSIGLLLSLFLVQIARRLGRSVNRFAALNWLLAALGFGLAAVSEGRPGVYFSGCMLAFISLGMGAPLISQIYRKHYPDRTRGHLFSLTAMTRASTAGLVGWGGGLWMATRDGSFSPLFGAYAVACLMMAGCVSAMAPVVLRRSNRLKWFDAFRHVASDRPFRKLLIVWMILGFGNLAAFALLVEFISNPVYGYDLGADRVGMLTSTIPMLVFIACVVPWGIVFDRLPFYRVRALVNLFFIGGILTYYLGGSWLTLCIGMALYGVARSGGNILWTLWVTRFADAERVVEYMSVHSFLTGVRGVIAPIVAFAAVEHLGPSTVAWTAAALIVLGTVALTPELIAETRAQREKPAV
jgi:MFS family permease